MKRYSILHRTYYNFSAPVSLGPHELRLRPREDHALRIESSKLSIDPPAQLAWYRDACDNSVAVARFSGATTLQLAIVSELIVQQYDIEPLAFTVAGHALTLPFAYAPQERIALTPYCRPPDGAPSGIEDWLRSVTLSAPRETYACLLMLAQYIRERFRYRVRSEPGVQTPASTLALGSGACRDFAALFVESARQLGLAARFVSGYLRSAPSWADLGATHAWAQVYLPGAGWKGFDPTLGGLAGPDHVAVAVARTPEAVPPVAGAFSGAAASRLEVGVWLTELPD